EDVAECGQQLVSHRMPEIENPSFAGRHEPGTENGIGFSRHQRPQDAAVLARIVLKVRILNDAEFSRGVFNGRSNRGALALVSIMADEADRIREEVQKLLNHLDGFVSRSVVDDDEFTCHTAGKGGLHYPSENCSDEFFLV